MGRNWCFWIEGKPVPQERPAAVRVGNRIRVYDRPRSRQWKRDVGIAALPHKPTEPSQKAIVLVITVRLQRPKRQARYPTVRPDLDNIVVGIQNALTGLFWVDDSQVVELEARKMYAVGGVENAGVFVYIRELE